MSRIVNVGRALDAFVGRSGASKTTTLRVLRAAWEADPGEGSVVGPAPSAAEVLSDTLRTPTEITAKWAYEYAGGRLNLQRRELVILDEASLACTLMLDRLVSHAREVGARCRS